MVSDALPAHIIMTAAAPPRIIRWSQRALAGGVLLYCLCLGLLLAARLLPLSTDSLFSLIFSLIPVLLLALPLALVGALLSRARIAQLAVLALVIPVGVWGAGVFLPRAQAVDMPAEAVRVLVFNASGKNAVRSPAESWFNTRPADIILVQETFYFSTRDLLTTVYETYPYQAHQAGGDGLHYRGLSTFSTFPILSEGREGFDPDTPFTRAVIDIDGVLTAVYNVSLPAPFADSPQNPFSVTPLGIIRTFNTEARDAALDALIARLEQESLPMIVAGEFNLLEFEPAYTRLTRLLTDTYREAGTGMGFTFPAAGGYSLDGQLSPFLRLDYIWRSAELRAHRAWVGDQVSIADRLPLFADIDFAAASDRARSGLP
jgi:endonuclease/exonuclease/phosphatase (EEP) superfamily protein YafD